MTQRHKQPLTQGDFFKKVCFFIFLVLFAGEIAFDVLVVVAPEGVSRPERRPVRRGEIRIAVGLTAAAEGHDERLEVFAVADFGKAAAVRRRGHGDVIDGEHRRFGGRRLGRCRRSGRCRCRRCRRGCSFGRLRLCQRFRLRPASAKGEKQRGEKQDGAYCFMNHKKDPFFAAEVTSCRLYLFEAKTNPINAAMDRFPFCRLSMSAT